MTSVARRVLPRIGLYALIALLLAYCVAPFLWLLISSFQTEREIVSVPPHWVPQRPTLENYIALIIGPPTTVQDKLRLPEQGGFVPASARDVLPSLRNSLLIGLSVAFIDLLLGSLAAYALARLKFRGKGKVGYFILALRIVPDVSLVIPFFLLVRSLGLLDNPLSLIMTYVGTTLPFAVYILTGYFGTIPEEIDEAAQVDGCTRLQALFRVILPIAAPGLIAAGVFSFMASWNEFLYALVFTKTAASLTIPVVIATFTSDFNISFSLMNAAGVVSALPPVVLAMIFQRYLVEGLSMGAVKE